MQIDGWMYRGDLEQPNNDGNEHGRGSEAWTTRNDKNVLILSN
jgi:hypothetical protein